MPSNYLESSERIETVQRSYGHASVLNFLVPIPTKQLALAIPTSKSFNNLYNKAQRVQPFTTRIL